jgi:hypothetical protein
MPEKIASKKYQNYLIKNVISVNVYKTNLLTYEN